MVKEKRPKKDEEMENLFRSMRKKSKVEKTVQEIAMQVEEVMASLEIAVGDDVELNKQGKPAISKLIKLPLLSDSLSKKQLQAIFLDHGVLSLLKNWLEPLPDGSLPNINVRAAVLKILNDLPVDLDQECIREQMEKSSLGKKLTLRAQQKANKDTGRAEVPRAMSTDFTIRPPKKFCNRKLEALVKFQMDDNYIHDNIMKKLKEKKALRRKGMQAMKVSTTQAYYGDIKLLI
ncbi:hypothetical protein AALP_AA7G013600 [Arabis alpina]|uniref:TFIIS N-terminal domain-containing protein n=1 Tax=Arabis alpina TaxID=50452 RepID=A0A087GFB8_ARAAL|nr:hypothetical protein AALP_AA7G013600 [Arabis alpina]